MVAAIASTVEFTASCHCDGQRVSAARGPLADKICAARGSLEGSGRSIPQVTILHVVQSWIGLVIQSNWYPIASL